MDTINKQGTLYNTVSAFYTDLLSSPLVLSFPHSGEVYPDDFEPNPNFSYEQYDQPADRYVDTLFQQFHDEKIASLKAEFPRVYVDVNRRQYDLAEEIMATPETWGSKISRTTGTTMIWGDIYGKPTYARKLSNQEIRNRIAKCYLPYHQSLTSIVESTRQKYGVVYLLDCHSMMQYNDSDGKQRPQIDIGTRHGTSCDNHVAQFLKDAFEAKGYYVGINEKFAGGEITQRYGWPECNQHALQIEFRRDLYMNEETRQPNMHFSALQQHCSEILMQYNAYLKNLTLNR